MGSRLTVSSAVLAMALAFSPADTEAQVFMFGGQIGVSSVLDGTFGAGARLGAVPWRTSTRLVAVEAVGDWFFPSCATFECDLQNLQFNLLFQQRVGPQAQLYGGAGLNVASGEVVEPTGEIIAEGTNYGLNIIIGSSMATDGPVHPFLEFRISFMDGVETQGVLSGGIRIMPGYRSNR